MGSPKVMRDCRLAVNWIGLAVRIIAEGQSETMVPAPPYDKSELMAASVLLLSRQLTVEEAETEAAEEVEVEVDVDKDFELLLALAVVEVVAMRELVTAATSSGTAARLRRRLDAPCALESAPPRIEDDEKPLAAPARWRMELSGSMTAGSAKLPSQR